MTVHTNKILVQRYYEEMWNTWNFALTDELPSAEISFRGLLGVEALGRMAFCEYMRQVRNAFPDFHNKIEQLVAEGDQVIARLQYTGTIEERYSACGLQASRSTTQAWRFSALPGAALRRDGSLEISSASFGSSERKRSRTPRIESLGQYNADFCRRRDGCSWRSGGSSIDF
jgi:predicted SnoaL-like aldol condensation-catalyzing enzyme